jgi:hypothetical protein
LLRAPHTAMPENTLRISPENPLGFAIGIANAIGIELLVVFSAAILVYGYRWVFTP